MASKRSRNNGFMNIILSGVMLVLIAGGILAWINVNNIRSFNDALIYFRGWSNKAIECTDEGGVDGLLRCNYLDGSPAPVPGTENPDIELPPSESIEILPSDGSVNIDVTEKLDETTVSAISQKLETLTISEPISVDYVRSDWKHWIGSPCNTRQDVLIAQGNNVETNEKCKILSGTWIDPYSLVSFDNASDLDIDHVIPLSYAAQMGGNAWDKAKKEEFANDKTQLLAVSAKENRSKGDKGPSKYMPPNKDFHCKYSAIWIETSAKYGLSITAKDKVSLEKGLKTCN